MGKSLWLSLGLVLSVAAVFSALTAPDAAGPNQNVDAALPSEILAAEEDYETRQHGIEGDLLRLNLSSANQSAEDRRNLMGGWMEQNRSLLEEQVRRSNALDALYQSHGIKDRDLLEIIDAQGPRSREEAESPMGRHWALNRELAAIRVSNEGNAEKLRDAMYEWHEAHSMDYLAIDAEIAGQAGALRQVERVKMLGRPAGPPLDDAPENMRVLLGKLDALAEAQAADPSPLALSQTPLVEELDAWRKRFDQNTRSLVSEINELNQQITNAAVNRIASDNPYERAQ